MKTPSPGHAAAGPQRQASRPAAVRPQPHSIPAPRVTPKQTHPPTPILTDSAASSPPPRASPPGEPLGTLLAPLTPLSEIPFIPGDSLYLPGDSHHLLFLLLRRRSRLAQAPQPPRREPGTSGSLLLAGPQGLLGIVVSVAPSLPPFLRRVRLADYNSYDPPWNAPPTTPMMARGGSPRWRGCRRGRGRDRDRG